MRQNPKSDKSEKLKLWQNAKTQIVKKHETQIVTKLKIWTPNNSISYKTLKHLMIRTTWHLDIQWNKLWAAFCNLAMNHPQRRRRPTILFQNFLRTLSWLFRTFSGLSQVFSGLSQDYLRTFSGLSQNFLSTFSKLSKDFLKTCSWLSHNFFRTFSRLNMAFLRTFLRHSELGTGCRGLVCVCVCLNHIPEWSQSEPKPSTSMDNEDGDNNNLDYMS